MAPIGINLRGPMLRTQTQLIVQTECLSLQGFYTMLPFKLSIFI
nr:MAG TPA: hypothetical protein [Caudoviricetes sp.]